MSEPKTSDAIAGACLCGRVRFEVTLPSLFCAHCHCSMCQRNHGAAFVTWFGVLSEALRVVEGEGELVRYASSAHGSRSFCGHCGSSLFCRNEEHPERVDIVLANMSAAIDRSPQMHVHVGSTVAWFDCDDALPRLGGESGLEPL